MFKTISCSKVQQLSVPKIYPKYKSSVNFDFDPTPAARPVVKPVTKSDAKSDAKSKSKRRSKSDVKPKAKCLSWYRLKQHKYDCSPLVALGLHESSFK